MNRSVLVALVLFLAAAPAAAQPGGWPPPPPPVDDTATEPTTTDTTPEPEPAPVVAPTPAPEPAPAPPPPAAEPVADRPTELSVGIGLGYDLPADLQQPNTTSVRFRLPSGVTVEPFAAVVLSSQKTEVGGADATTSIFGFEVGTDVRLPYRVRGPVDLVLIGGAGLGTSSTNPEGSGNDSSAFFVDLHWGLGLEYWIRSHWTISLNATNPLLRYTKQTQEDPTTGDQTTSRLDIGAVWEPDVVASVHLFL